MLVESPDHVPHPPGKLGVRSHFRRRSHSSLLSMVEEASSSSAPRRNSSDYCNANSISNNRSSNMSRGSKCGSESSNNQVRSLYINDDCKGKREWSKDSRAVIMSATSIVAVAAQYSSSGPDVTISTMNSRPQLHRSVMSRSFECDHYVDNEGGSPTSSNEPGKGNRRSIPTARIDTVDAHSSRGMKRIPTINSLDSLIKVAASMDRNDEKTDPTVNRNHNTSNSSFNNQPKNSRNDMSKINSSIFAELHLASLGSCSSRGKKSPHSPGNSETLDGNLAFPNIRR